MRVLRVRSQESRVMGRGVRGSREPREKSREMKPEDRDRPVRFFGFCSACFSLILFLLLNPFVVAGQAVQKKIPVTVKADRLDYDRTADVYTAEGNVLIEQEGIRLEADRVVLNNRTGEAVAEGRVHLQEKENVLRADRIIMNLNTKAGVLYNGEIFMSKDNHHLKGEKIERLSETIYRIENGRFTTCDENEWYIEAKNINVDMDRYATGNDVSFKMAGLPIFYTPYLLFPVRRQSGLLIPEIGLSSSEGFLMKNFIFWAISDYSDMTFTSDYRRERGHGTGIEYRYVNSRDSSGMVYYNYFNTSAKWLMAHHGEPDTRWEFRFQHREEFAEDLSARADINLVSDERYYRDLEKKLELISRPYVDSNAFYVERWDQASLYLMGRHSIDLTQPNDHTIQKLPELRYTIFKERIAGPLFFGFDGSATNFSRRTGDGVRRADFNPSITAALGWGGISFTPTIGGRATFYDRGETSAEPIERTYYYATADLNMRFSRVFGEDENSGIGRVRHSIEPAVSYNYLPSVSQTDIPKLDSIDEVSPQNIVTLSLINRLTARYKDLAGFRTYDLMVLRFSQGHDLEKRKNNSDGSRSTIKGELFLKTPKTITISASGEYDTYIDRIKTSSGSIKYTGDGLQLDLTHRYLREPRTEFLIGGAWFKLGRWDLSGHWWLDMENRKTTQEEYRAHYLSQCWGLGISYIQKPAETQYLMMLELKGLGAIKF